MMETYISNFHKTHSIPVIENLSLHQPRVWFLGTHHCGNTHRYSFKRRSNYQDILCLQNYTEYVVASFAHNIQYKYYGGNISVSIELESKSTTNDSLFVTIMKTPCII